MAKRKLPNSILDENNLIHSTLKYLSAQDANTPPAAQPSSVDIS